MSQHYIAIEGVIGVGKTSLAKRLASDLKATLLLEPVQTISHIKDFYGDIKNNALATQLSFFTQRLEQMQSIQQDDLFKHALIADYIWQKDALFAEHTLSPDEFKLYQTLNEKLQSNIRTPNLVVYLQAPIEVLMQRIEKRARPYERKISYDYLFGLYQKYSHFFYHYKASPLLMVNAGHIDWVNNEQDYQILKENILATPKGRQFLNFDSQQLFND